MDRQGSGITAGAPAAGAGRPVRHAGAASIAFAGPDSRLAELRQGAPLRFLRPTPETGEPETAVLANTAGGVAGGDRLSVAVSARDGARALVVAQAAEKFYRSDGAAAEIDLSLESRSGAALEFLSQGAILFDGARLKRRTALRAGGGAALLYGEILLFGRAAMGETLAAGAIDDRVEVFLDGRRAAIDALRLDGDIAATLGAPAGAGGAAASAAIHLLCPAPEDLLAAARAALAAAGAGTLDGASRDGFHAGAGVFEGGPLVARLLGRDGARLRHVFASVWRRLRAEALGRPARMPRIWSV